LIVKEWQAKGPSIHIAKSSTGSEIQFPRLHDRQHCQAITLSTPSEDKAQLVLSSIGQMEEVQAETSTSSRLELMTASFERCLRYGLRMPTFQVLAGQQLLRSFGFLGICSCAPHTRDATASPQEFQMHFPTLPEPVVHALLELYQQVLAHIEVHSKVSAIVKHRCVIVLL
jgi:hypothetical protein